MKDPFVSKRRGRFGRRLLELDGALDGGVFSGFNWLSNLYADFSVFMRRFRVFGWQRLPIELGNETLTWGTVGMILLLALAQPAFDITQKDWRKQDEYSVTFVDRSGVVIGRRGVLQNKPIDLDQLPDYVIKATLATEDRRFFSHFGVDVLGIARAFSTNVQAGGVVEGGSSITQQVAKNIFLTNERTLTRKVKEAFLAIWLEANLTKNEILELYFNRAYLGGGAFGIPAAAEFYFDKNYADLTLAESAMLAGLFKAPTNYAPHINLAAARERANEVLTNMVQAGFLSEGQVLAARQKPATAINRRKEQRPDYFLDWAYEQVLGLRIADDRVLTVVTGLDIDVQKKAEDTINAYLAENGEEYNISQGAAVIMTPEGFVRAMVGGRDYGQSQFNRAVDALRSPGSTFKPFVYATAMENGFTPKSMLTDGYVQIGNWSPKNYTRNYAGPVTLTTALVKSINTIPVKLAQAIGRSKVIEQTHAMGITSELRNTPSLPIGTSEISVIDMTAGYSVFANGGYQARPKAILRVYNSQGDLLIDNSSTGHGSRVLSEQAVRSMNEILTQVPEWGTGGRAKLDDRRTAGKTGTTQSYRDAWFIGYTGNYVGAVWYGNDNYTPTNRLTGGRLPAMTWKDIMTFAHQGIDARPIPFTDEGTQKTPQLVDITEKTKKDRVATFQELRTLSSKTNEALSDIGSLLRKASDPLKTALTPLEASSEPGFSPIAGGF